ncbi:hypothetical protein [Pseudonocardia xishanensis]|uniref:Uncharacterized protein n=1 Tax=Pseudonocardia xishanensis TaxID=630995 RepID=A0ABP8RCU1_9PSEU
MDPTLLTAIVSAGAGLCGAIVGSGSTIWSGRLQHRRGLKVEAAKEARGREIAAATQVSSLLVDYHELDEKGDEISGEANVQHSAEVNAVRRQIRLAALQLPEQARSDVETCLQIVHEATSLVMMGLFYWSTYSIRAAAFNYAQEVCAAVVRGGGPPEKPVHLQRIIASLADLDVELRETVYAEEEKETQKWEQAWLNSHPEFAKVKAPLRTRLLLGWTASKPKEIAQLPEEDGSEK